MMDLICCSSSCKPSGCLVTVICLFLRRCAEATQKWQCQEAPARIQPRLRANLTRWGRARGIKCVLGLVPESWYYICVTFHQAPSPGIEGGIGGGPADSPTNVASASSPITMPRQGFDAVVAPRLSPIVEVTGRHSVCDMSKKYHFRLYQVSRIGSGIAKSADSAPSAFLPATMQLEGLCGSSAYMVMRLSTNTYVGYVYYIHSPSGKHIESSRAGISIM